MRRCTALAPLTSTFSATVQTPSYNLGWKLGAVPALGAPEPLLDSYVDAAGHVQRAYGHEAGDWRLVRPDGYVAAIVTCEQLTLLERYLERVGVGLSRLNPARR